MSKQEKYLLRELKTYKKLFKNSCKNLDNLLNELNVYWNNKMRGCNSDEKLRKAFSKAEEFIDNIAWEDL